MKKTMYEMKKNSHMKGAEVVFLRNQGMTFKEIGESFGVSSTRANQMFCKHVNSMRSLIEKIELQRP